jgi:hypothetical protein
MRGRDEHGAVALLVAALSVLLLICAALSVDIGLQVNRKHTLVAALDSAAQAGASKLPSSTIDATTMAVKFAATHDYTENTEKPSTDFWCVVAADTSTSPVRADASQMPSTCYPGSGTFTNGQVYNPPGSSANNKVSCSAVLCAIPCAVPTTNNATPKYACNTIRVFQGRQVPFSFGPAGGIRSGSTGSLVSVACRGTCGTVAPNPMDVVVIADRTTSMETADLTKMLDGIKSMLGVMTPSQQYVALGSIGRSINTDPATSGECSVTSGRRTTYGLSYPSSSHTTGTWLPVAFSNDYQSAGGSTNASSTLIKGVDCLSNPSSAQGTMLASPLKAAARYLLGYSSNNLNTLPAQSGTPQKVIIFETDGQPNEIPDTAGSTSLTSSGDVYSDRTDVSGVSTSTNGKTGSKKITTNSYTTLGGSRACQNFLDVANAAKAAGILVIVVGYNMVYSSSEGSLAGYRKSCTDYDRWDGTDAGIKGNGYSSTTTNNDGSKTVTEFNKPSTSYVSSILASAASPDQYGVASSAQNACSTDAERAAENSDGDYFFCAASGDDMAPIFKTALSQASSGIKLMNLPGS